MSRNWANSFWNTEILIRSNDDVILKSEHDGFCTTIQLPAVSGFRAGQKSSAFVHGFRSFSGTSSEDGSFRAILRPLSSVSTASVLPATAFLYFLR
jgi:hypothetical protein